MADDDGDRPLAPRRSLGGPVLPPPPPQLEEQARKQAADKAAAEEARQARETERAARAEEKAAAKDSARQAREKAKREKAQKVEADKQQRAQQARPEPQDAPRPAPAAAPTTAPAAAATTSTTSRTTKTTGKGGKRPVSTRKAQLRLVQVDAWSVMKTSFLLSIALGIVLVVAVAIIMSVLGAAGVWESVNSIVQQAVGSEGSKQFDIQQYVGPSRVLGFTMILAVVDVILITAIATLGAFLYNLSAALLGGIEVTLAEDS